MQSQGITADLHATRHLHPDIFMFSVCVNSHLQPREWPDQQPGRQLYYLTLDREISAEI